MSQFRFGVKCDQCGERSQEYGTLPSCRECGEDVCQACQQPGTHNEEKGVALCKKCVAEMAVAS